MMPRVKTKRRATIMANRGFFTVFMTQFFTSEAHDDMLATTLFTVFMTRFFTREAHDDMLATTLLINLYMFLKLKYI